jgi:hypothetical protein
VGCETHLDDSSAEQARWRARAGRHASARPAGGKRWDSDGEGEGGRACEFDRVCVTRVAGLHALHHTEQPVRRVETAVVDHAQLTHLLMAWGCRLRSQHAIG